MSAKASLQTERQTNLIGNSEFRVCKRGLNNLMPLIKSVQMKIENLKGSMHIGQTKAGCKTSSTSSCYLLRQHSKHASYEKKKKKN